MKVFILITQDIDDNVININDADVYHNKNTAKKIFDELVNSYKENNDFDNYDVTETEFTFQAVSKEYSLSDHVYIDLIEKDIIED